MGKKESKCTWYNCVEKEGDESTTWSEDKQEFCCKKKNIGCKFDCMTKDVWSEEKKAWCCENKKLGCECPEDCWTFFDGCNKHKCYKGATSRCIDCFKKKTCDIKKESKCTWYNCREKKGDESTTWSDDKKEFCCKKKNIGCKDDFDCTTDDEDWDLEKKKWCCSKRKWVAWTLINVQKVARCFLMAAT